MQKSESDSKLYFRNLPTLLFGATFGLGLIFFLFISPAFSQKTPGYKISSLRAKLFFYQTGDFSENIVDNKKYQNLWNTTIGEGDAGSPSEALLVLVEIAGTPGSYESTRKVHLIATEGKKTILNKNAELGILSEKGRCFAGFWLYDTGINPIQLSAEIIGQADRPRLSKTIDFQGGE
jgi:hypothetical protein